MASFDSIDADMPTDIGGPPTPDSPLAGVADAARDMPSILGDTAKLFLGGQVPTEDALNLFALLGLGVTGAAAQVAAAKRLSQYPDDTINARRLLPAVAVASIACFFAGASLIPVDSDPTITGPSY